MSESMMYFILGFVACLFVLFVFALLGINNDTKKDDGKS
jgi:hypothetical protein